MGLNRSLSGSEEREGKTGKRQWPRSARGEEKIMVRAGYETDPWAPGEETMDGFVKAGGLDRIVAQLDNEEIRETEWDLEAPEQEAEAEADEEGDEDEVELDLEASKDQSLDPMRLYLREMSTVPLLTREDEVRIAKRIERGKRRIEKIVSRSLVTAEYIAEIAARLKASEVGVNQILGSSSEESEEEGQPAEIIRPDRDAALAAFQDVAKQVAKIKRHQEKLGVRTGLPGKEELTKGIARQRLR